MKMNEGLFNGYVVLAFALAVGGGALGASLGTSHRRLCALISLGAGTLFGVTVFAILPESFESLRWWGLLLALGSGCVVFVLTLRHAINHHRTHRKHDRTDTFPFARVA